MKLQGSDGALMKFVALGSIADGEAFTVGNEHIIFFVKGTPGKEKGAAGALWIYDNSYVHLISECVALKLARGEYQLASA